MPKSRVRKKAVYTPPPRSAKAKVSPPWLAPTMLACLVLGLAWIAVFYLTNDAAARACPRSGDWNMVIGVRLHHRRGGTWPPGGGRRRSESGRRRSGCSRTTTARISRASRATVAPAWMQQPMIARGVGVGGRHRRARRSGRRRGPARRCAGTTKSSTRLMTISPRTPTGCRGPAAGHHEPGAEQAEDRAGRAERGLVERPTR